MSVYFVGSSHYKRLDFKESLQTKTAYQLNEKTELPYFTQFEQARLSLTELYKAIDEQIEKCLQQTGWQWRDLTGIPIFLGSTGYVIADCEARLLAKQPLPDQYNLAVIGSYLSERYHCEVYSLSTSCTSSAQGIYYATQMLKQGLCHKALVIGFEPFNRLTFEHFHSMHLLSNELNYQPLQISNGIVLGEGLGCIALSTCPNAAFPCELLEAVSFTDFANLTNNSETALQGLIEQILKSSAVSPNDIALIKPHAVGGNFDNTEKALLSRYFPQAHIFSAKTYLGHTLGASGVLEMALLSENLLGIK